MVPYAGNTSGCDRNVCVVDVVTIVPYVFYMVPYAGNARASVCNLCVVGVVVIHSYVFLVVFLFLSG